METTVAAPTRTLVAPRDKKFTGMPTSGLFVLVGLPKSAKTTLIASAPNSYVLECEAGGADRVDGRIEDVADLQNFREAFKAAVETPEVKIIGVDTIDVVSEWWATEIAKSHGLEAITERRAGVDGFELWGEYGKRVEGFIAATKGCGKLVVVAAHCKDPKLDEKNNVIIPAGINVYGKAASLLASQADLIGYTYKKQVGAATEYFLTFRGGPLGIWGSRVEELNDKTIRLDRKNPWGSLTAVFDQPKPSTNGHKTETVDRKVVAAGRRK